jgi:hypothetical protein
VNIGNPDDIAKPGGIQHPTQLGGSCIYQVRIVCESIIDVPANQRLIIEYVSVACEDMSTLLVGVHIATTAGGVFTTHQLTTDHSGVLQSDNVKRRMQFGQMVRLYADPGSKIAIDAETTDINNRGDCGFSLAGQAIDVP